jgi:integrase
MYSHIRAHLTWCEASGLAERTRIDRGKLLTRVHHQVGHLHRVSTTALAAWLAGPTDRPWSQQTRRTYWQHLCGYYRWAVAQGVLHADPTVRLAMPRVRGWRHRVAPPGTVPIVAAWRGEPWRTVVLLGALAGLRCGEIAGLRREAVTREAITVVGKGGRIRRIPTHDDIWAHLADRGPGLLVVDAAGRPYGSNRLSGAFSARAAAHGAHGLTLHGLRHHWADGLRRAGLDVRVIQEGLGHTSLATTMIYLHPDEAELAAGIGQLRLAA